MYLNPVQNFIDNIFDLPYMPSKGATIFLLVMFTYRLILYFYKKIKIRRNNIDKREDKKAKE